MTKFDRELNQALDNAKRYIEQGARPAAETPDQRGHTGGLGNAIKFVGLVFVGTVVATLIVAFRAAAQQERSKR